MSKTHNALGVLVAGTCINLTIGVLYAWSVIKKGLVTDWLWTNTSASMPYNVAIAVWAIALLAAGVMQDKIGPKKVITLGVVLVGLGLILASFAPKDSVIAMTLAIGVVVGSGIGFTYACVTPAAMKWFHATQKGMISGITVGGFGLAAVYLAPLCAYLIATYGISQTFLILGVGVLVLALPLTRLISNPPEGYLPAIPNNAQTHSETPQASATPIDMTWREMLTTRQFYLLWIMFVFASSAGVMIIGNLASIAASQVAIANPAYLVSILAVSNAGGRVGGGMLSDKVGRTNTMLLAFALQAVNMLLFATYRDASMIVVGTVVAGLAYGSLMSVFPSTTADMYGLKNYGANYGVLYTAWGVSGFVGPLLAGFSVDLTGSYFIAFMLSAVLLVLAIALGFVLKRGQQVPKRLH